LIGTFDWFRGFELGNNQTALYQVSFLLDPLSESAQKWSKLIEVSRVAEWRMMVFLNRCVQVVVLQPRCLRGSSYQPTPVHRGLLASFFFGDTR
jgi:hypothetical protein